MSSRFFATAIVPNPCRLGLTVYSPPAAIMSPCVGDSEFGPKVFDLNGLTQVGSPLNACAPMASLVGKIAIIVRGACGFVVKVKNAQNAGAIGVIVYNTAEEPVTMGGVDNTIVIPTVSVAMSHGLTLVANSPVNVTIRSGGLTTYSSQIYISVSKTSAPNTRNDFFHYLVTNGTYASVLADYPKHAASVDTFYITNQQFGPPDSSGLLTCLGANVRAFRKSDLINGVGPTSLWDTSIAGSGLTGPEFVFPAEIRTPITDQLLPMLFVGLSTGNFDGYCDSVNHQPSQVDGLNIYAGDAAGLRNYVGHVPFPTPMEFVQCAPSIANSSCTATPTIRQPPPATPAGLSDLSGAVMTGVVSHGRLYTAFSYAISPSQVAVRWFEINVAPIALGLQPVLRQWGDLNVDPDINTFMPHIDVTDDGTMGIVFYTSGSTKHVTASYTVRLADDPPNSVRVPFHDAVANGFTTFDVGIRHTRYGDYTGLQVDPVDRQTFYGYTQRPDPLGAFFPANMSAPCFNTSVCILRSWTSDLFTFRVRRDTCPTDGIETTPTVLPSTSAASASVVPAFTGALADFVSSEDEFEQGQDCISNEEGQLVCVI